MLSQLSVNAGSVPFRQIIRINPLTELRGQAGQLHCNGLAACKHLQTIDLFRSPIEPDFAGWKESPVEKIQFKSCKFKEFGDIAFVPKLSDLSLRGCRSLERFKGDNSSITRLEVDACRKLDLRTLGTFTGVEVIVVNSCTKEVNLTEIKGLKNLKRLHLILCKVEVEELSLV